MAYSTRKWAKVRAAYETGNYSVQELRKKYGISTRTIEKKIADDKWQKGKLKPAIEEGERKKVIDAFMDKGIDADMIADKVHTLLTAKKKVQTGDKEDPKADEVNDAIAIDKGITQYAKMTGAYAPQETKAVDGLVFEIIDPKQGGSGTKKDG